MVNRAIHVRPHAEGEGARWPRLEQWIRQLATVLPSLHVGAAAVWTGQLRDPDALTEPASARRPDVWTAARSVIATEPPSGGAVFVHGDYQHFNVLWSRGRLSALVDWSSSRIAPPDVDVGHCRLNRTPSRLPG